MDRNIKVTDIEQGGENKDKPEVLEQGKKIENTSDILIPERLTCCPECKEKGMVSPIKRLQYEVGRYWVCCTREYGCNFLEEYEGNAVVTKEDLIMYGLPGQLADHIDIFYEDINKIVRLCMSEYIKIKYLMSPTKDFDLKGIEEAVRILAEDHGLDGFGEPNMPIETDECNFRADEDPVRIIANPCDLQSSSQSSPTSKSHECDMGAKEGFDTMSASFQELNRFDLPTEMNNYELKAGGPVETSASFQDVNNASVPSQSVTNSDPDSMENDDLLCMFQNYFISQPLQSTNTINSDLPFKENEENKPLKSLKNSKNNFQSPNCFGPYDSVRKLAKSLVADLPLLYQEKIKTAFCKIEGYNFPEHFQIMTAPDKLPLFKILQEREREERIKAEMDEQIMDFMAEIDGIKELLE